MPPMLKDWKLAYRICVALGIACPVALDGVSLGHVSVRYGGLVIANEGNRLVATIRAATNRFRKRCRSDTTEVYHILLHPGKGRDIHVTASH
jgi:hypothetical protein